MDLAHGAGALASTEEGVLDGGVGGPAETALVLGVLVRHVTESPWHLDELFKLLLVHICENAIRAVPFLLLVSLVAVHGVVRVADLLHGELDAADLQNVSLLNFIILTIKKS